MRVAQGTYSTKSETLLLPWPALRHHSQRSLARPYAAGTRKKFILEELPNSSETEAMRKIR